MNQTWFLWLHRFCTRSKLSSTHTLSHNFLGFSWFGQGNFCFMHGWRSFEHKLLHLAPGYFCCKCLGKCAPLTPVVSILQGSGTSSRRTRQRLGFLVSLLLEPPQRVGFQDSSRFAAASSFCFKDDVPVSPFHHCFELGVFEAPWQLCRDCRSISGIWMVFDVIYVSWGFRVQTSVCWYRSSRCFCSRWCYSSGQSIFFLNGSFFFVHIL